MAVKCKNNKCCFKTPKQGDIWRVGAGGSPRCQWIVDNMAQSDFVWHVQKVARPLWVSAVSY